jgi:hypothetical protein
LRPPLLLNNVFLVNQGNELGYKLKLAVMRDFQYSRRIFEDTTFFPSDAVDSFETG